MFKFLWCGKWPPCYWTFYLQIFATEVPFFADRSCFSPELVPLTIHCLIFVRGSLLSVAVVNTFGLGPMFYSCCFLSILTVSIPAVYKYSICCSGLVPSVPDLGRNGFLFLPQGLHWTRFLYTYQLLCAFPVGCVSVASAADVNQCCALLLVTAVCVCVCFRVACLVSEHAREAGYK